LKKFAFRYIYISNYSQTFFPILSLCSFFSSKLDTCYPKRDKESITNECPMDARCSSSASLFLVVGGATIGNDNRIRLLKINVRRVITHRTVFDAFTAIRIPAELRIDKNITKTSKYMMRHDVRRCIYLFISPTRAYISARALHT